MNRHVRTAAVAETATARAGWVLRVNVVLVTLCLVLLVSIIVTANTFAGAQVGIATLQSEIRELREAQHRASALVAEREHPSRIEAYAGTHGMVVADEVSYVAALRSGIAGVPVDEQER